MNPLGIRRDIRGGLMIFARATSGARRIAVPLLGILCASSAFAADKPATGAVEPPPAALTVDPAALKDERATNAVVVQRIKAAALGETREISRREAALAALSKNLSVRRSGLGKTTAELALVEATAVFDPVFVAGLSATQTLQQKRVEKVSRFHPETIRVPVGQTDSTGTAACTGPRAAKTKAPEKGLACYFIVFGSGKAVEFVQYDQYRGAGYKNETLTANDPSSAQPKLTHSEGTLLGLYQQLPWGAYLSASANVTRAQTYYALNTVSVLPATYGSYKRPWTTSVTVGVSAPLPFTRNFGGLSGAEYGVKSAELAIKAAELDTRVVVNETLRQVEIAYWGLVDASRRLNTVSTTLAKAEDTVGHVRRLLGEGLLTESDRAQAEAEVARVQTTRESILGEYVFYSEALRQLTDTTDAVIFLPLGYKTELARPLPEPPAAGRVLDNPSRLRAALALQLAGLGRERGEVLTGINLAVTGSAAFAQSSAVYGYRDAVRSLARTFDPDRITVSLGLLFQRPLPGNRADTAALDMARGEEERRDILLKKAEEAAREEYAADLVQLKSALERIRIARENVKIERSMYERTLRLRSENLISPYETIGRLNALLNAETEGVRAEIDARRLAVLLRAAVGALPEEYGGLTAQTETDRERTAGLLDSGMLRIFGGAP